MISRFQHILLPVDFTEKNRGAIETAVETAVQHDARVSLLHVIERVDLPQDDELESFYTQLEERARSVLSAAARRFDEPRISTTQTVVFGRRAEEIVKFSEEQSVDLILMSSHRVDPTRPVQSWSTVSYQVSLMCSCPVLLLKADD